MTLATTALFSAAAAAAYLDGRYHIGQDVAAIRERRLIASITQAKARTKELSMWYPFEETVRRCPDSPCLWYRTHPSQTAVQYTFQQTYDQALRWAAFLLHHGVKPGELVGTYLQNSPEFMFNMAACWAIGCAPALINYNLANDSLLHCLKIAGSKVVLVDEDADCRERIEAVRDRIENDLGMRIIVVDEAMRRSIDGYPATRLPDEHRTQTEATFPAFLFYTSGSTGLPKACAFQTGRAYVLGAPRLRTTGLKAHPNGDTWYDCMPLYHGTGCTVACTCLMAGLKLAIGRKFSVRNFWPDIHDSKANCFVYVGETARYLLAAPPSPLDKTHQLKAMYGNGMRPDVFQKFRERFNVPCVNEFFNSTEGMFSLLNVCQNEHLVGCVGHFGALQRYTHRDHYVPVRIDYEQGDRIWRDPKTGFAQRTPYSEGGEILVRCVAETDFCGYWNNPEATAKRFERDVFTKGDLWYRTGDALRMDHDGRWFFLDRLGDTFRWKSENVSTAEVAEVLGHFPGVVEANVYGVEIPGHDGRAGCAAVYIPPNKRKAFDYAALLAHARKALPKYAVPVFLRVIKSPTPMHNNKQNKVPLRKEGVDPAKITTGEGGSEDVMLWVKPGSTSYEAFSTEDWKALMAGNVRL